MSQPTLPADRPRWAVRAVRVAQAALAVLAVAVLAWGAVARHAPDRARIPAGPALVVTDATLRPPGYIPVPAGPPCPASDQPGVDR